MVFFGVTLALLIVSFLWALLSLKKELSKPKEISHAKKAFQKEKILFKRN